MYQQLPFSIEEYAERFGRVCRSVFRGETWDDCEPSLRKSWEALSGILTAWKTEEMTWEEAQPFIHKAWA